jgi:uncharacterized membrane protein YeiB
MVERTDIRTGDSRALGRQRAISLDALRGLAIVGMMAADNVPWSGLPAWMYHGQEPPPSHDFNPKVTGITWVDLVFPFFLFSMGAAIPLAQSNRDAERPAWVNSLLTLSRGLLLVAFAIFNQHVRPESLSNNPGRPQWEVGILGFLLALAIFGRTPSQFPRWAALALKGVGWLGAVILLSRLHYPNPDMPGFAKERSDIIILVLATVSVFGTYAWRLTRWLDKEGSLTLHSIQGLAVLISAMAAFRIAASVTGSWESLVWAWKPEEWIFSPTFLGYLIVVLPGCIAGTLLGSQGTKSNETPVMVGLACLAVIPVTLVVLFQHANPMVAACAGAVVVGCSLKHLSGPCRAILLWGLLWLVIGCLLEPFEGGIKKDPYTLSYLFVASGLATFGLIGFVRFPLRLFATVGQNPLLAYQAVTVLIPSLWPLALAPLFKFLPDAGWPDLLETSLKTVFLVGLIAGFSRFRFTMRV